MCSNVFKLVQNLFKCVQTCSKPVQMCSNMFKLVQNLFKCVQMCSNLFKTCSNVFKLVQTCLKLAQNSSNVVQMGSKLVQMCQMCSSLSKTCSNVFKIVQKLSAFPVQGIRHDKQCLISFLHDALFKFIDVRSYDSLWSPGLQMTLGTFCTQKLSYGLPTLLLRAFFQGDLSESLRQ